MAIFEHPQNRLYGDFCIGVVATSYPGNGQRVTVSTNPDGSTVTNTYLDGRLVTSLHSVLGTTSYTYDEFGRMKTVSQTIGGIAQTSTYSYNALGQVTSITDPASRETSYLYDTMGRRTKAYLPGNGVVNYEYYDTGELKTQYGTDTYSQRYAYDAAGRMKTLTTYKNWSNNGPSSGAESTTWSYDSQRGFMTSKTYANSKSVGYSYYADGSLNVRTWARGITTTYTYNNAGALAGVDYSDSTPDISYTYNRLGYPTSVTDGAGTWAMAYYPDGSIASTNTPHIVNRSVVYEYDLGLRTSMNLMNGTTTVRSTIYKYEDTNSRLKRVEDGTRKATYTRVSGSNMLSTTTVNNGTSNILTTTRTYDNLNRLTQISSAAGSNTYSYTYTLNDRDKRTKCTLADGSYWIYEYDDLGQVTKGKKYTSTGYEVPGQSFGYDYDTIGNLITENRNGNVFDYTSNSVNQYTQRTVPGRVNVSGNADIDAKVTIKHGTDYDRADRFGEYFNKFYTLDNSSSSVSDTFDIYAVKYDTTNSRDDVAMQTLNVFIPQTPEAFTYDDDGNQLVMSNSSGIWNLTWNAENRLISAVRTDAEKVEFEYDYMGRRTTRKLYSWVSSDWQLDDTEKYVWDGYNIIAVYDGSNNLLESYLWGEDLSGSLQGAGGVGGLLAVNDGTDVYCPIYDGNGNITKYVDISDGSLVASYEYNPKTNVTCKHGSKASDFKNQFSTKPYDQKLEVSLYEQRILKDGRWLSRDSIGESGGENLYAFVDNDAINWIDILGNVRGVTVSKAREIISTDARFRKKLWKLLVMSNFLNRNEVTNYNGKKLKPIYIDRITSSRGTSNVTFRKRGRDRTMRIKDSNGNTKIKKIATFPKDNAMHKAWGEVKEHVATFKLRPDGVWGWKTRKGGGPAKAALFFNYKKGGECNYLDAHTHPLGAYVILSDNESATDRGPSPADKGWAITRGISQFVITPRTIYFLEAGEKVPNNDKNPYGSAGSKKEGRAPVTQYNLGSTIQLIGDVVPAENKINGQLDLLKDKDLSHRYITQ